MDETTDYLYRKPTFGYRSESRLVANNPYGTYPGKNNLLRHNNNDNEFPLLQSTANAFEVDWQPPINPALLPPPSPRRISPTRCGGSPPLRAMRASSPQKGILKCRASPAVSLNINGRPPNMFDCPTSSSTLALVDCTEQNKNLLECNGGLSSNYELLNKFIQNKQFYKVIHI